MYFLCYMTVRDHKVKTLRHHNRERKECRANSGIACHCLRHEKNYSSYLWSHARVPLCIQLMFTFFYLLMQPFISMSNTVAEKNKAASHFLTRVSKS